MKTTIEEYIQQALTQIEQEEDVRIVYACESGSRAWGFQSEDSDYDVRFIYVRPTEWYLSIQNRRDVIEWAIEDTLDISGWDLRKTLHLFRKSNPPLFEWLRSPIVYREASLMTYIRDLIADYYSPVSCTYHYLHMAKGNYREYLQGDIVWVKKYFYVLRPILACLWIERGFGIVPVEFAVLVDKLIENDELKLEISGLMESKRKGRELDRGPRIPAISEFIDNQLPRLSAANQEPAETKDLGILDKIFVRALVEINGASLEGSWPR